MPAIYLIEVRRDLAANWSAINPTLSSGEFGLETDTRKLKLGDGATAWNSLDVFYQPKDADLTAIAALATDPFGRGVLELTDAEAFAVYTATVPRDEFDDLQRKFRILLLFLMEQGIQLPDDLFHELETVQ